MGTVWKLAALAAIATYAAACASSPVVMPTRQTLESIINGTTVYTDDGPKLVALDTPTQCVPYARDRSGIALRGNASTWWDQARGQYEEDSRPQPGSVMVLGNYAGPRHGHVAFVSRVVSQREIRVDHTNWMNDGNLYLNTPVIDVSDGNDWSLVKVWNTRDGHLGERTYQVRGFILPKPATSSAPVVASAAAGS